MTPCVPPVVVCVRVSPVNIAAVELSAETVQTAVVVGPGVVGDMVWVKMVKVIIMPLH